MAVYWVTFRIHRDATYETRYEKLNKAITELFSGKYWNEPTSFVMFESNHTIDTVASHLSASIRLSTDLVLIGMNEVKSARVIGHVTDSDLFKLMPFVK